MGSIQNAIDRLNSGVRVLLSLATRRHILTGEELDHLGFLANVERFPGEPDNDYRDRVLDAMKRPGLS